MVEEKDTFLEQIEALEKNKAENQSKSLETNSFLDRQLKDANAKLYKA